MLKPFKEMDPEVIQELLKGQVNVIAPAVAKEQEILTGASCPSCGESSTEARVNGKNPFSRGKLLVNKSLSCIVCGCEFDPYSKLITKPPRGG